MSALSNELFFEAHRGIHGPISKQRGLGMHFSADLDIARNMAERNKQPEDFYYKPKHTTVIHAKIPVSSVETDKKNLMTRSVWASDNLNKNKEQEIPVKPGSSVLVTGITTVKANSPFDWRTGEKNVVKSRTRTRRYNPPREMKA